MKLTSWTTRAAIAASVLGAFAVIPAFADDASDIAALKARVAELEKKEGDNWLTEARAAQIKSLVQDVLADAKNHGQGPGDSLTAGYDNGFYLQTADGNNKLVVGGFAQVRFTAVQHNANIKGTSNTTSDGFEVRRARVNFSGNIVNKDITFKLEGDFYGGNYLTGSTVSNGTVTATTGSSGPFNVTDAYIGYRVNDAVKFRVGSFKVPFTKVELTPDTGLDFVERPEVNSPFDPVRALGLSLYGDIIKDQLGYEVNANDGAKSNVFRLEDTTGTTPNLDNRLAFYARVQYAGAGKISDFADEADLRKDNSSFIWLAGLAGGYESQSANPTPSPQTSLVVQGLSNQTTPGYANVTVNGDVYRATADLSAKWQGWSFITAAYFQQLNQTVPLAPVLPHGTSEFEFGGYGQAGYFIVPPKFTSSSPTGGLELVGRAGVLSSERGPNSAEYFSLGANYYISGHNAQIGADVTYSPDAAYTDTSNATAQIVNTSEILARIQFQLKF